MKIPISKGKRIELEKDFLLNNNVNEILYYFSAVLKNERPICARISHRLSLFGSHLIFEDIALKKKCLYARVRPFLMCLFTHHTICIKEKMKPKEKYREMSKGPTIHALIHAYRYE